MKSVFAEFEAKMLKAYDRAPQVKFMIAGNFLDMVDRGHIRME